MLNWFGKRRSISRSSVRVLRLPKTRRRQKRRLLAEALEPRQLLAGDVTPIELSDDTYLQDFNSGLPSAEQGWEYHSTGAGRIQSVSGGMRMDASRVQYSLNEAIIHLNLKDRAGVELVLDHDSIADENRSMPSSFKGHHDSDGIAFSSDGETWHRLTSLRGDFDAGTFSLDAAVADAGIEYTTDFQIKFQQYDNFFANYDGRFFDNIQINVDPSDKVESEVIYETSFTSGVDNAWTLHSTAAGRIQTSNGQLKMDSRQNGVYSLNEAVLQLDLRGRSGVKLQFDHDNTRDENREMPASFLGSHNSDGVAISNDGATWHRVTTLTDDFSAKSFDLDAAIRKAGIDYTSDFQIKFQQYDNFSMPIDGRAFDNVIVTAEVRNNPPPVGRDDNYAMDEDTALTIDAANGVLANDSSVAGSTLRAVLVNAPENGQLTISDDGSFVFSPDANFHGTDRFTYQATYGAVSSKPVEVLITINPVNDAPTAIRIDRANVTENEAGVAIGRLRVDDVDSTDRHVLTVDDQRFEIEGDLLKLRPGISLNHEAEPMVEVTVTAMDTSGASYRQTIEITVADVVEPGAFAGSVVADNVGELKNALVFFHSRQPLEGLPNPEVSGEVVVEIELNAVDTEQNRAGYAMITDPQIRVVRPGQTIVLKNKGSAAINLASNSPFAPLSELIPAGQEVSITFDKASRVPIRVHSNIDPTFNMHFAVLDHGYAAVTDDHGNFHIDGLPEGQYRMQAWHQQHGFLERDFSINVQEGTTTMIDRDHVNPLSPVDGVTSSHVLKAGQQIEQGDWLTSSNGEYHLGFDSSGRLLRLLGRQLRPGCPAKTDFPLGRALTGNRLRLQRNGNLALFRNGHLLWSSDTAGNANAQLTISDNGHLFLESLDGKLIWHAPPLKNPLIWC